ncbi:MAG TPA: hypothetical protein VJQ82_18470 [Terriglobales bacterium]|nr:hypothetical protein [Terriglobales bacterium]
MTHKFYRKFSQLLPFLWVSLLLGASVGCTHKPVSQQTPPPPSPQQSPAANDAAPAPVQIEPKISPKEAEALFQQVDEILKFASDDTGLPIKKEVKRRLTSRDEVESYLQKNMSEDKDAQRLRRSELVLKKFGLLPREFNLQTFLVALLKEQVAGYYDPKTKTVNLLDWVGVEQQRPVMAHELTHALQDQSFGLEKWMKAGDFDIDTKKDITWEDIEHDEIATVRQAVVEGQAMVTLVDYMLAPTGQSIKDSPQVVDALKQGMLEGTPDSVQFHNAPIFLKEALTFPYRYGLDFESALLTSGGRQKAFVGPFLNPPRSTRQIMEPKTYLSGEQIPPVPLVDFKKDLANYERFDLGAMGEFDVAVLMDQYVGADTSREVYPAWRGGYYYAAKPKGDPGSPLALLYVSRWSSSEKAAQFAAIYAKSLTMRYRQVHGSDFEKNVVPDSITGKHTWTTEEGLVEIEVRGDTVLVTESFDQATVDALENDLFNSAAAE